MHISEAMRVPSGTLVEVFGYLIIDSISEKQFLCENLLESYPPQCGGLSIELRGRDLRALSRLHNAEGLFWTDQHISVTGSMKDRVLWIKSR